MKKLTQRYSDLLILSSMNKTLFIGFSIALTASISVYAEETSAETVDCGKAEIRYSDSPELTRAERIALMEKAFFDSINRFESCNLSTTNSSSADNAQSSDSGAQAGGDNQGDITGNNSAASQEMQGTEPEREEPESSQAGADFNGTYEQDDNGSTVSSGGVAENGAIPEDIPSANNDDAIASQIRLAAETEQDPEIKKKLWNEYRKYKGMDIVED